MVDREKEIEEFDPEPYWEIYADMLKDEEFESQYFYREDGKEQERIWDEETAEDVFGRVERAADARVDSVNTRTRNDYPPTPFDTTQFIRAAGAIGFSASRAMSVAEELYTQGFISYPRTDNTVYPDDIEAPSVLEMFTNHDEFAEDAAELLNDDGDLTPTSGDKETTDHPPIYPTSLVFPDELSDDEWRIYELVVRRFFATFADAAKWEHIKAVFDVKGETFKANGKRMLDAGYHAYYPYFNTSENRLPKLEEGETVEIAEARIEDKETKPPNRIGQSKLVERMEELGVGTKSTRHNTIQKLYDRGYVENSPPQPTEL
ncbi:MAG: DNA topoisomerase, partial [Halobacteria archaeon]|nr:DNA topoisomerase [Halobacteria archaeon]